MFHRTRPPEDSDDKPPKKPVKASKQGDPAAYARHKEDMRQRMAAKVAASNEIGPLPPVKDESRRASCEFNLQLFSETYVRGLFKGCTKRWAQFHIDAFRTLQDAILNGGLFAIAIPRGSGKSAMVKAAIIWAGVYGHCKFAVVVCASDTLAKNFLRSVKKQLRSSRRLFDDFPEVCHPIRKLDNKASKCNSQTLNGVHTACEWRKDHVVFATVSGRKSSGFKCATSGITGSGLRGLCDAKEPDPDDEEGDVLEERVDFVAVDDFQTRGSARSVGQTETRLAILRGDILGMSGPGEKFAVAAAVTVIEPNDGAAQLLKDPNWRGMLYGILTKLPDNMDLWRQYREIQIDSLNRHLGIDPENDFYREHRALMDQGTEATWPDRYNPQRELSAIQAAMNLLYELGDKAFHAEHMNKPLSPNSLALCQLEKDKLRERLNKIPRYRVPFGFTKITVGADVQLHVIFYWVTAWKDDFTGAVIDFGVIPHQGGRIVKNLDDLTCTLQTESGASEADVDAAVTWGLTQLGIHVLKRQYWREDNTILKVKRVHIDINWQKSETAVSRFCRLPEWVDIVFPSRGQAIGDRKKRISEWAEKPGEQHPPKAIRRQCEWMLTPIKKHLVRECYHLKSFWIGRLIVALTLPIHSAGSISFFGDAAEELEMAFEHLTAHDPIPKKIGNDEFIEYVPKVGVTRWDLLDCFINSAVAASVEGVQLSAERADVASTPKRRTFSVPGLKAGA